MERYRGSRKGCVAGLNANIVAFKRDGGNDREDCHQSGHHQNVPRINAVAERIPGVVVVKGREFAGWLWLLSTRSHRVQLIGRSGQSGGYPNARVPFSRGGTNSQGKSAKHNAGPGSAECAFRKSPRADLHVHNDGSDKHSVTRQASLPRFAGVGIIATNQYRPIS